jgi:hypothetical protein
MIDTMTPSAGQSEPAVILEAAVPWAADPECDCSVCESVNSAAHWATLDAAAPADLDPPALPDDDETRLSLAELTRHWAARFRLIGSDAGDLLADAIGRLAADLMTTRAATAAEHRERMRLMAEWREDGTLDGAA